VPLIKRELIVEADEVVSDRELDDDDEIDWNWDLDDEIDWGF
jgi:hypothetical protein